MDKIEVWVKRLLNFDWHTDWSDDHGVWKRGIAARSQLRQDFRDMEFTDGDIELIAEKCVTQYNQNSTMTWTEVSEFDSVSSPRQIMSFLDSMRTE